MKKDVNWLQALELTTFVIGNLTESFGESAHPEAGFKLGGLMFDTVQFLEGQELDFPIMVEVLAGRLGYLAWGRWQEGQDPSARWVPDDDPLPDWCPDYKRGITKEDV